MATTDSDCIVSIDDLAKELESMSGTASNGTFHKVPESLVKGKEEDYTPRLVSIGPYHSQNQKLAKTNKLIKMQFLHGLIDRSPQSNSLKKYFDAVHSITQNAMGKYSSADRKNNGDGRLEELATMMKNNGDGRLDKLATMMVVDGCFIIELFLGRLPRDDHPRAAAPNISRKQLAFLHTDVLLVENQIPFFVLEELFKASHIPNLDSLLKDVRKSNSDSPFTFTQLALAYFEQDELIGASAKKFYTRDENMSFQFDHLFHLYHSIWDPSFKVLGQSPEAQQPNGQGQQPNGQQPRPTAITTFRCWPGCLFIFLFCWAIALYYVVSLICKLLRKLVIGLLFILHFAISYIVSPRSWKDLQSIKQPSLDAKNARFLHDMGIKFKKNTNAQNWLDISLTEGVLKIPALPIHQRTIIIFRNMVAFEELDSQSRKKNFTAFAKYMNTLIDSKKDVAILRKCGIIQSELEPDKEVADFFNNLCNVTVLDRGSHGHGLEEKLFKNLESYKDNRYEVMIRQWRMTLIPDSLRSSWAIPAIIVGLIIVLPSALQTFNTIYSMIYPPPHPQQLISAY